MHCSSLIQYLEENLIEALPTLYILTFVTSSASCLGGLVWVWGRRMYTVGSESDTNLVLQESHFSVPTDTQVFACFCTCLQPIFIIP